MKKKKKKKKEKKQMAALIVIVIIVLQTRQPGADRSSKGGQKAEGKTEGRGQTCDPGGEK